MTPTLQIQNKSNTLPQEMRQMKRPKKYKVIFHNDDYTPFDFVEGILLSVFRKTITEAEAIADSVDKKGSAVAGVYTKDIAETKIDDANCIIKKTDNPLLITMELEE